MRQTQDLGSISDAQMALLDERPGRITCGTGGRFLCRLCVFPFLLSQL